MVRVLDYDLVHLEFVVVESLLLDLGEQRFCLELDEFGVSARETEGLRHVVAWGADDETAERDLLCSLD